MQTRAALDRIALVGMLIALAGCSYGQKGVDPRSLSLNPRAVEAIQVRGVVPDQFRIRQIRAIYQTDSSLPMCNGLNFPDGGPFPLHSSLTVPADDQMGRITSEVLGDRYSSGLCGWRLSAISAVVEDGERDRTQVLIASMPAALERANQGFPQPSGREPVVHYCGYAHGDFGCGDGPIGDASYMPATLDRGAREARFVIRVGKYPAPITYRRPCRDAETDVPVWPCPTNGR